MKIAWILFLTAICFQHKLLSQSIPPFKSLRYDEDYTFLKRDTNRNWYRRIKYSPLPGKTLTLSTGGELRLQYFYNKNEGWGDAPEDDNGYALVRSLAHADLKAGRYFRTFLQLQSSIAISRIDASPVEQNPLEIHQLFFDIATRPGATVTARVGRQELQYGSQRLVSVREGPNNRQSFDGLKIMLAVPQKRIDLFYTNYVLAKTGFFDDGFSSAVKLWGAYTVLNSIKVLGSLDLYYLGLRKRLAVFDDGQGKELRHSTGVRIWDKKGNWNYDFEALYQFGKFADGSISAWTSSLHATYTIASLRCKPLIGLKTELISGDQHYDDKILQTFNPLFPRGAYFGLAALIGPSNLVDIHPSLAFTAGPRLELGADFDKFWRYSTDDGLYAVNGMLVYSGKGISDQYIGQQFSVNGEWSLNQFVHLTLEFTWFDAGRFLKAAGNGKDILFAGVTAQCKF